MLLRSIGQNQSSAVFKPCCLYLLSPGILVTVKKWGISPKKSMPSSQTFICRKSKSVHWNALTMIMSIIMWKYVKNIFPNRISAEYEFELIKIDSNVALSC